MMQKEDFSDVQSLLALKRNELPSADYFETVLPEFHRRQRAALLRPKSALSVWWSDVAESFNTFLHVAPATRYITAAALLVALLTVGTMEITNHAATDVAQIPTAPRDNVYAFNQALESRYLSKIDQTIDAASVGNVNSGSNLPHYVLADVPAGYDATIAF